MVCYLVCIQNMYVSHWGDKVWFCLFFQCICLGGCGVWKNGNFLFVVSFFFFTALLLPYIVGKFRITFKRHFSIKNTQNGPVTFKHRKHFKEQVNQMGYLIMNRRF